MDDVVSQRKIRKKEFQLSDGTIRHVVYGGDVHYPDSHGNLQDCNFTFQDQTNYWQIDKANHRLYIAKQFDGTDDFPTNDLWYWRNRRGLANHGLLLRPHSLRWVNNPDLSDMSLFRSFQSVGSTMSQNPDGGNGYIEYLNAFGADIDFQVHIMRHGLRDVLRINQKSALSLPPTANHKLALFYRYNVEGDLRVKARDLLEDWDKNTWYESSEGFNVIEMSNPMASTVLRPAHIWDSAAIDVAPTVPDPNRQRVRVFFALHAGSLWMVKILPTDFLKNAVYPVLTDASPQTSHATDGWATKTTATGTWADCRDAATADDVFTTSGVDDADMVTASYKVAGKQHIVIRAFFPFDLSGEAGGTVATATLSIFGGDINQIGGVSDGGIGFVDADMADPTSLAVGDFNGWEVGGDPPTLFNVPGNFLIANWHSDAHHDMPLTTAGKTFVENALGVGYADFAAMEWYYDGGDTSPGNNEYSIAKTRYNEYTGATIPTLAWTLTGGLSIPIARRRGR